MCLSGEKTQTAKQRENSRLVEAKVCTFVAIVCTFAMDSPSTQEIFTKKLVTISYGSAEDYSAARSAKVAELADAPDLGSGGVTRGGSSPPFRTKLLGFCSNF